jgi:imidazolonepropionase-like amidohydrolase
MTSKRKTNGHFGLKSAAIAACLLGTSVPVPSQAPAVSGGLFIRNARIFDGTRILPMASVLVKDGRVTAVGPGLTPPDGVEIVDGTGRTLLPGLIDAHVHVWSADSLKQCLYFGVTSVVDMFTSAEFMTGVKRAQSGPFPPLQAYFISPGILATAPGGHGTQFGVPVAGLAGPADAAGFVDARIAEGADFVKIIYDDGSAYKRSLSALSRETMKAVVEAAHAKHMKAVVHAGTLKRCAEALEAGADGIAHLNFDDAYDPDFAKLAAAKKAFVIPTLSILASMNGRADAAGVADDPRLVPYFKLDDIQALRRVTAFTSTAGAYAAAEREIKELAGAGVPILAGTDAPNPGATYGPSIHGELELLVRAGLAPIEALRSATSIPAKAFGMAGRGSIAPGAFADFLLVEGDPAKDIKATRAIVGVWKSGIRIDRDGYLKEVRKSRDEAERRKNADPPADLGNGLISDFESETIKSNFGAGWMVSTDSFMGGKSKAEMALTDDGANGSRKSLLIKGTIAEEGSVRWAGAFFSPGPQPMSPVDLSGKPTLKFRAKGSGKSFAVMMYSQSAGYIPKIQAFQPGPEWQEFVFPFSKFGLGGQDIMGLFFGASNTPGEFSLQIDDVRLE